MASGDGQTVSVTPEDLQKVPSRMELAAKPILMSLGLLYLTGFLVVTFHLASYGVFSLALIRSQYVVAGLFLFVPCAMIFAFISSALTKLDDRYWLEDHVKQRILSKSLGGRAAHLLWDSVLLLFGLFVFLSLVAQSFSVELTELGWKSLAWSSISIMVFGLVLRGVIALLVSVLATPERWVSSKGLRQIAFALTIFLVLVLQGTKYFAGRVYSLIPYEYGGGRPLPVVFVLKENAGKELITSDGGGRKSIPYGLLTETSDAYFVLSQENGQRAVELKKDSVQGVIILRRGRP